jgi:putative DNA primase/helicase
LRETFEGEKDDGFIQRFQVSVYPDPPHTWRNIDRYPDTPAKQRAFEFFERLDSLDATNLGAEQTEDDVPALHFAPDAQELFDTWREELEGKLRREGEHPVVVAHLAKFRSLAPSLALIFHLAKVANGGPVSSEAMGCAAGWCDFLEAHARRIYEPVIGRAKLAAVALSQKVLVGDLSNPFTSRDVDRHEWSELTNPEDVRSAIAVLENAGWLRREETNLNGPGRSGERFWINPKIQNLRSREDGGQ